MGYRLRGGIGGDREADDDGDDGGDVDDAVSVQGERAGPVTVLELC